LRPAFGATSGRVLSLFMVRRIALLLALAGSVTSAPLVGQTTQTPPASTPASQQPTFRARVDSVTVDVEVTDKQGRPVTDLTADDFEVKESNKVQTVDTFKLIKIDDDPNAAPTHEIHSLEAQQIEASRDDTRLIVVFLDDYHTRRLNSMRIRQQLAQWMTTLGDRDLVAVTYPLMPPSALTFTYDHEGIASAIAKFEGRKYDYTPKNAYEEQYQMATPEMQEKMRNDLVVGALRSMCIFLGGLRDGRKSILYVSEGMTGMVPPGIATMGTFNPANRTGGTTSQDNFANSASLMTDLIDVFKEAARNNTSIYTIDPRGLASSEFDINDTVGSDADRAYLNDTLDTLRTLANQTNGRAIVSQNDPGPALQQMLRDSSAYYLLGYTSSLASHDGKFHEIQVRVKRNNVDVRARKGYWAYTEEEVAKATTTPKPEPAHDVQAALDELANASAPSERHPIRVWTGTTRGASEKAAVTFAWEAAGDAPADAAAAVDRVQLVAQSSTGEKVFEGTVAREQTTVPRTAGAVTFPAPAGRLRLHLTVENDKGVRLDVDDRTIDVPDYTAPGPTVTEPVVFRGRTARDIQQIRSSPNPVPTAARSFSRTERLLLRFQAYGPAGQAPAVTLRLLNQAGDNMAELPAPTTTPNGFESDIGLAPLPAGDFIIEINATVGTEKVRRLLAIHVTS
jgi:VWFA-related protein